MDQMYSAGWSSKQDTKKDRTKVGKTYGFAGHRQARHTGKQDTQARVGHSGRQDTLANRTHDKCTRSNRHTRTGHTDIQDSKADRKKDRQDETPGRTQYQLGHRQAGSTFRRTWSSRDKGWQDAPRGSNQKQPGQQKTEDRTRLQVGINSSQEAQKGRLRDRDNSFNS